MILIADDDPFYSEDLEAILRRGKYPAVKVVATGEEVVALVPEHVVPDLIVLDMMIPYQKDDFDGAMPPAPGEEARGLRVARELKENGYDMSRIVVITALLDDTVSTQLRQLGVQHVLFKPVETARMLRMIAAVYYRK